MTCGLVFFALTALFNHQIVAMFIDRSYPAYDIAVAGLPLFASGFIFFAVNIVSIGYFLKCRAGTSGYDGYSFAWVCFYGTLFIGLPLLLKVPGIWLAVPLAEILTFLVIMVIYYRKHSMGSQYDFLLLWSSFCPCNELFSPVLHCTRRYIRVLLYGMRTAFKCVLDMFCQCLLHCNRKAIRFWLRAMLLLRPRIGSYR